MGKIKIQKNRADSEMLIGMKENITFENDVHNESEDCSIKPKTKSQSPQEFYGAFFTPDVQEKLGRSLLELKMELFKQGIVDFKLQIMREGQKIILTAQPTKKAKAGENRT